MLKANSVLALVMVMLLSLVSSTTPSYADGPDQDEDKLPPKPITVTSTFRNAKPNKLGMTPDADISDPGGSGAVVVITNNYYPYCCGRGVGSDGNASGNFVEPSYGQYQCWSSVRNNAGQNGSTTYSSGSPGASSCPTTPMATLAGVLPATYTTWTDARWLWPSGNLGSGRAEQSYYQGL
jgi:hypothetical protein